VIRRTLSIVVAVMLTACGTGSDSTAGENGLAAVTGDSALMEQWKVELIEADREFERSLQTGGLGTWLHAFGPNGMMISGGAVHIGQEGVRQAVLPMFADPEFELTWNPTFAAAGSGNLGYTVGTYELTLTGEVGLDTGTGTYLTVWRRDEDGAWRVEADIGSPAN